MNRRLSRADVSAIEEALEPHDFTDVLRFFVEFHLAGYASPDPAPTEAQREKWAAEDRAMLTTARRLLDLITRGSHEDALDAVRAGTPRSALAELLAARIAQWERRERDGLTAVRPLATWQFIGKRATGRPAAERRRDLLRCMLGVLRDSGLSDTSGEIVRRQQAERFLGAILAIADRIDGLAPMAASQRLIRDTLKGTKFGRPPRQ